MTGSKKMGQKLYDDVIAYSLQSPLKTGEHYARCQELVSPFICA